MEKERPIFVVGDSDELNYYYLVPYLNFFCSYHVSDYFKEFESVDLDSNGSNDIAFVRDGYSDLFMRAEANNYNLSINNLNDYELVCSRNLLDNYVDTLSLGDTLSNDLNWVKYRSYKLIDVHPTYTYGHWNIWGDEKYIGFRKIDTDTIMGWLRLKFQFGEVPIILKDCAIQK